MTLYDIDNEITACIMAAVDEETGEVVEEFLDIDLLNSLQMERERKLEGVALWIKNLKADAEAIRTEEIALAKRRRSAESKIESLKVWLMYALGDAPLKTARCAVSVRNTPESPKFADEAAFITWAENGHDELLRYNEPEINKKAVKAYLKDGGKIEGVTLERGQTLIIK